MKSVSFLKTASTYRPDDEIQQRRRRHPIQFDSFLQIFISSIWMCRIYHFCLPSFGTFFSIHLTNSLTTNSWQWNIPKYCSHLLVLRCVKFVYANVMLADIYHFLSCVLWLWHSRSACTGTQPNHIWKSLLNITKYRSKNNMHFSIHIRSFVHSLFATVRYTLIFDKRRGKKTRNDMRYSFSFGISFSVYMCVRAIPRSKSLFSLNVCFVCICSVCE